MLGIQRCHAIFQPAAIERRVPDEFAVENDMHRIKVREIKPTAQHKWDVSGGEPEILGLRIVVPKVLAGRRNDVANGNVRVAPLRK